MLGPLLPVKRALAGNRRTSDDDRWAGTARARVSGAGQETGGNGPLTLGDKQQLEELRLNSSGNDQSLVKVTLHVGNLCLKVFFRLIELLLQRLHFGLDGVDGLLGPADGCLDIREIALNPIQIVVDVACPHKGAVGIPAGGVVVFKFEKFGLALQRDLDQSQGQTGQRTVAALAQHYGVLLAGILSRFFDRLGHEVRRF